MIIVTGATGQLGRAIVLELLDRLPAEFLAVSVRDPEKASDLAKRGVRVRRGDFDDSTSLRHAFEGAGQILLVSSNARSYGGDPLAQHGVAIEAAKATGARRIVYTSHMGVSRDSAFPPMLDHFATETMLSDSGLAWTALRNGFYASSGIGLMGDALKTGMIEAPADGKVSWTTHADLAAVAAIILSREGCYDGATPPLTGPGALDLQDLAAIASELLGRRIERRVLTDTELRAKLAERGLPERVASISLGLYAASRAGEFARVDRTLTELLQRAPISMRDCVAAAITVFKTGSPQTT